jgi:hypothetical protein
MIRTLLLSLLVASVLNAATQPATLDLRADKEPLFTLIERIARQCDAGLLIHHSLQVRMNAEVTIEAKDAKWADAMALLSNEYHIVITVNGDRIEIDDADREFRKRLVTITYDVRSLTASMVNFPGPELSIPEPSGNGSRLIPPDSSEKIQQIDELITLVKNQVAPPSWERSGTSLEDFSGQIVVTTVPEIQTQVAALIAQLERTTARQVICRCYRLPQVPDSSAVLDAKAWQALSANLPAPVAVFVSLDEQQNHHFSGQQRAYLADADVNQGAFDPIMSIINNGIVFDIEPHVTINGVLATVRLSSTSSQRWSIAQVNDAKGLPLVPIETPEVTSDNSRDTRVIPSGGASLYRFGDHAYAITFEVLDYAQAQAATKP